MNKNKFVHSWYEKCIYSLRDGWNPCKLLPSALRFLRLYCPIVCNVSFSTVWSQAFHLWRALYKADSFFSTSFCLSSKILKPLQSSANLKSGKYIIHVNLVIQYLQLSFPGYYSSYIHTGLRFLQTSENRGRLSNGDISTPGVLEEKLKKIQKR